MQIIGPCAAVNAPKVYAFGSKGAAALEFPAGITVLLGDVNDADSLITAVLQAKDIMVAASQERQIAEAAARRQLASDLADHDPDENL